MSLGPHFSMLQMWVIKTFTESSLVVTTAGL